MIVLRSGGLHSDRFNTKLQLYDRFRFLVLFAPCSQPCEYSCNFSIGMAAFMCRIPPAFT